MMLPRHCLAALAAASMLGQVEPAHACGATPCVQLREVQPLDGSVGVPRNTELRALYFGTLESYDEDGAFHAADLRPMRLVPSVGEPIELAGAVLERPEALQAWAVAQHVEALAAHTTYQLQLPFADRDYGCTAESPEWHTVSSFTTGGDEDREVPSFAGIESIGKGEHRVGSSTCGTSDVIPLFPQFRPATDDAADVRYNIYADGQIVQRYAEVAVTTLLSGASIFVDCGSSALSTSVGVASGASLELRAVDLAGNESPSNTPIAIEADCMAPLPPPQQPEVGPVLDFPGEPQPPPTDAPPDSAASGFDELPAENSPGGRAWFAGCAITHAPVANPLVMLAALLSLLCRRTANARRAAPHRPSSSGQRREPGGR